MTPPITEQNRPVSKQESRGLGSSRADAGVQQMRDQARSETTREQVKTLQGIQTTGSGLRNGENRRLGDTRSPRHQPHHPVKHHHREDRGADSESERREQRAIAAANRSQANRSSGRGVATRNGLNSGLITIDPESLDREENVGLLRNPNKGAELILGQTSTEPTFASDFAPDVSGQTQGAGQTAGIGAERESIKLLELVGPQATLTFREKLAEVWVKLDESATKQLDVIARLPANLKGQSAMELLMVESPQGVHFVAFLKNKGDFEVLGTFDRRALIPNNPSRQLVEAGIHAYEQLDSVARGTGEKLEQTVRLRAQEPGAKFGHGSE